MARVTVEDCLQHVDNRFQLVILAAKRARQLMRNSVEPLVPWENDKATVVALREIAEGYLSSKTPSPDSANGMFAKQATASPALPTALGGPPQSETAADG